MLQSEEGSNKDLPMLCDAERMVDHFRIMRLLGRGGMGEVYLARDTKLGRKVALKVVHPRALGSEDAIERFLFEARATARFNHPHIITVYAVGEDDGSPYLALEYLEGESLRCRLEQGLPGVQETTRIALAIAEALKEAHGRSILHRDLKPENVMLGRDGRLRVLDFGLAKVVPSKDLALAETLSSTLSEEQLSTLQAPLESDASAIAGTPGYMAPEQWSDVPVTAAADIWAMGVLLHEMVAGRKPYEAHNLIQQALEVCGPDPVPPLDPELAAPQELVDLIGHCLRKEPRKRPSAADVAARLQGIRDLGRAQTPPGQAPFRGLLPFDEDHRQFFFGRDAEIEAFVERVRVQPVLPVVGPSGAGKSSFVQAGVIPRLRERGPLVALRLRPGRRPFQALASQVVAAQRQAQGKDPSDAFGAETAPGAAPGAAQPKAPAGEAGGDDNSAGDVQRLAGQIQTSPALLNLVLQRLAEHRGASVLLFVDQLEELYALVPEQEVRQRFMEALCAAADDPQLAVRVVFTLREEFLGRLAEGPGVRETLSHITVLRSPDAAALVQTLVLPVEAAGCAFEDPELPREMVAEVGGERACLPLLQFCGQLLWERRDHDRGLLLRSEYEAMGGVAGALARHAEGILAGLPADELRLARSITLRLVTADGTRRAMSRAGLLEGLAGDADAVLQRLTEARLITATRSEGEGEAELELAHESLINSWAQLRRWIDESHEDLVLLEELGQAARLWVRRGQRDEEAWQGDTLQEGLRAVDQYSSELPAQVISFLKFSQQREKRRLLSKRAVWVTGIALLVVVAVVSVVISLALGNRERDAQRQRSKAEDQQAALLREGAQEALKRGDPLEARAKLRASLEIRDSLLARTLWRRLDEEPVYSKKDLSSVIARVAFSPDGKGLAAASVDGLVYVLSARTMRVLMMYRHRPAVYAVALSPDGQHLASAGADTRVVLGNIYGKKTTVLKGHKREIWSLDFNADGTRLASAGFDETVRVWNTGTGAQVAALECRPGPVVFSVRFSPDGKSLAAAGPDNTVKIWDAASGATLKTLVGHKKVVTGVAFHPGGKLLASTSLDQTVRLWDLTTGVQQRVTTDSSIIESYTLAFSPDGKLLACSGFGGVWIWDVATGALRRTLKSSNVPFFGLSFGPRGRWLATGSYDKAVRIWDMESSASKEHIPGHLEDTLSASFSPDGKLLASGSLDKTVRIWDVASGTCQKVLEGHGSWITSVNFSPDGRLLASGDAGKVIRLWRGSPTEDPADGGRRFSFDDRMGYKVLGGHTNWVVAASFLPNGRSLVSTGWDRSIRLWDVESGTQQKKITTGHTDMILSMSLGPGGRLLATGSRDKTVRIHDLERGTLEKTLHLGAGVGAVSFSPDGKTLALSADNRIRIQDMDSGTSRVVGPAQVGANANGVAFHPGGKRLGAALSGTTASIFDLSGNGHTRLLGHRKTVNTITFNRSGELAATTSQDGTVRVWDAKTGRPGWRTRAVLHTPPRIYTHRGWESLGKLFKTKAPPATRWRRAIEQRARSVSQGPQRRILCMATDDDTLETWDLRRDSLLIKKAMAHLDQVLASPRGCFIRVKNKVLFVDTSGSTKELHRNVKAMSLDHGEILIAANKKVFVHAASSAQRAVLDVGRDVVAPLRVGDRLLFAYGPGRIRSARIRQGSMKKTGIFQGFSLGGIVRMVAGPGGTVIGGSVDGTVGLWQAKDGAKLDSFRLHGPVAHLMIRGQTLYAVSELGDVRTVDLSSLKAGYCDLLRQVRRRIPVVWQGGRPWVQSPDPKHRCSSIPPKTRR